MKTPVIASASKAIAGAFTMPAVKVSATAMAAAT